MKQSAPPNFLAGDWLWLHSEQPPVLR